MQKQAKLYLTTYPRCASNFLADHIEQAFKVKFYRYSSGSKVELTYFGNDLFFKSHEMNTEYNNKISIIRDPFSSISSMIAMESSFFEGTLENFASFRIKQYIEYCEYLLEHVDIIYLYEDVANKIEEVIQDISIKLNLDLHDYKYESTLINYFNSNNVMSSKELKNYNDAQKTVLLFPELLEKADKVYKAIKKKAISF